ncbi:hypothetical protein [Tunicatimonas pelagia]|uniref:hypothetical protein n=1 Tax=Tunicatimonas pelagia TaxID=931531 RepID=UPI00266547F7|nr:hypothetical protein [Tunicatimonas pelagia]WKN44409.1 hypothetical protein P0M28_05455 [Tunicatimonas pelagia]
MHTKPMLWVLFVTLGTSVMFSSCQSSKVAFGNSYYFKQTPKSTNQSPTVLAPEEIEKIASQQADLYTSLDQEVIVERDAGALIEQAQQQLLAAVEKTDNAELKEKALRMSQLADEMNGQELTKKEQRAKRKEIRKEVRSLVKEYKSMSPNETNDLDRTLKIALILMIVGLILLFIPVINILGLISFIAGLVFLIIWLVNEA